MSFCYFVDVDQESPWRAILHAAPMSHGSGVYALAHVMQASCHVIPETGGFDVEEGYHFVFILPPHSYHPKGGRIGISSYY